MAGPTAYVEVNVVLMMLLTRLRAVLANELTGLYVYGSLATGDFTPGRSDIDFLVVTTRELPGALLPQVEAMHANIMQLGRTDADLAWATKLEGPYIPREALRRYDPERAWHPALRVDGSFGVDWHASDWIIQRHVIREHGITVEGPPLDSLIDPVTPDELRHAAAGILREWWAPMLDDPARLHSSEYQAYAVLTMCRSLYTLQHGSVVEKAVAAQWAQDQLGDRWSSMITRALAWRHDMPLDDLAGVQALIRHTLAQVPAAPEV